MAGTAPLPGATWGVLSVAWPWSPATKGRAWPGDVPAVADLGSEGEVTGHAAGRQVHSWLAEQPSGHWAALASPRAPGDGDQVQTASAHGVPGPSLCPQHSDRQGQLPAALPSVASPPAALGTRHTRVRTRTYACTQTHAHTHLHTHIHAHARTCTRTCAHVHAHTHALTHTNARTHKCTHTHAHTHTCIFEN